MRVPLLLTRRRASIWKHEGMRGMFKGNGINVARVFPYAGLQFFGFETIKTVRGLGHAAAAVRTLTGKAPVL